MLSSSYVLTSQQSHSAATRSDALILSFAGQDTLFPLKDVELRGLLALVASCTQQVYCQIRDCGTSQTQRLFEAGSGPQRAFCSTLQSNKSLRLVI